MNDAREERPGYPAERTKAFADAVVAIAMTLLILPLMESVGEAGREGRSVAEWLDAENGSIIVFFTSFAVIAMFWVMHHRLFARVERVVGGLLWLLMAWLLTIVWLPVATALTGTLDADPLLDALYIGSMILTTLLTLGIRLFLGRHPELHAIPARDLRGGMAVDLAMTTLFALALVVAITVPAIGYFALFLLVATSLVERLFDRMLRV